MCKKDKENIIDNKKQKMKDYQKEYRKNITNEMNKSKNIKIIKNNIEKI